MLCEMTTDVPGRSSVTGCGLCCRLHIVDTSLVRDLRWFHGKQPRRSPMGHAILRALVLMYLSSSVDLDISYWYPSLLFRIAPVLPTTHQPKNEVGRDQLGA